MQSSARIHWQGRLQESAFHEIENIALNFSLAECPRIALAPKTRFLLPIEPSKR
jgi:hypothetical protein